jgi:hypothetical protein
VTNIGSFAFQYCTGLTGIAIPGNVTNIKQNVFAFCSRLTSVTIPNSVKNIDSGAFQFCTALTGMTIPGSLTNIGQNAFYNCTGLTGLTIPGSVTKIGISAFYGCTGLTGVTISNGVTSIGESAFYNCTGLTGITIPDSVSSIGDRAFSGCTGLASVVVSRSVVLPNLGSGTLSPFYNCFAIRNLFFDSTNWPSFKASGMFPSSYVGLTNLVIGGDVAVIGPSAFNGCTGLAGVTIPSRVTSIGSNAFYRCSGLTSVTIPGSVTNIGQNAFSGCTGLTSVIFVGNAPNLGLSVFASCTATVYRMAGAAGWPEVPGLWGGRPTALAFWYPFSSVGKTNAVQSVAENSGDGGTSVKMGGVGLLADGEMAGIECTATGPGVLAFDWKVSSEAGWDVLRFYEVGGAVTNEISGATAGWSRVHITINGASDVVHAFRWEYEKDPYGDYVGQDCGWVDSIGWSPFYTLTVSLGNGNGMYTNGTPVAITADAPPAWQQFDHWTGDTNCVTDVFAASTTLVMPGTGVVVTATYTPILYTLAVVNGSGGGSYAYATTVEIGAVPYEGKRFHRWIGDVDTVSNPSSATTTVVTAGHTLSISATYSVPLTVNSGSGSGWCQEGSLANVSADADPMWKEFSVWTGDDGLLSNANARTTTLTLPAGPAEVTATYRDSIARLTGSFGHTYSESGTAGAITPDAAAGSPLGTPAVKLGGTGVLPDNGFAAFETVVSGSGSILFQWKVSSELNGDYLKFKVDGLEIVAISGTKGSWTQFSNRVDAVGEHTLRWEYVKNGSISSSTDAGWLDDIVWVGDVQTPVLNPVIVHASLTNQNMAIQFVGERGITYLVQTNSTLNPLDWHDYLTLQSTWVSESNGVHRFEIIPPATGPNTLFYRISTP